MYACTLWLQKRSCTMKYDRNNKAIYCLSLLLGKYPSCEMITIRYINMFSILVQRDFVIWCNFVDIESFRDAKWSTSSVSQITWLKCSILIDLFCALDYIYMMQVMCCCWLCCFVHFLTNTCQLFITNCTHLLSKIVYLFDFGIYYYKMYLFICSFSQRKPATIERQWWYYGAL